MRLISRKIGFSLVETIVVVAIIAVLVSMVIGVGKHVKEQGNIKLTRSTIDILVTAVELYHQDEGNMPFAASMPVDVDFSQSDFAILFDPSADIVINTGTAVDDWSSEAMLYYLGKSINSKRIVNTISDQFVTSRDTAGVVLNIDVVDSGGNVIDNIDDVVMLRVVDAWGNPIRYRYTAGNSFCAIVSAGEDKQYGTPDDITNSN